MKKIIPVIGVAVMLLLPGVNHLKSYREKPEIVKTIKGCLWIRNIDKDPRFGGANYFCYVLRNKKDGATVGNTKDIYTTWYMNK